CPTSGGSSSPSACWRPPPCSAAGCRASSTGVRPRSTQSRRPPRRAATATTIDPRRRPMWVRQCDLDAHAEAPAPIPARIASNEEFIPPPQTTQQKEYEARLTEISERAARRQGVSRRSFLRTGSGMAAALYALNQVFGDCYAVEA